MRWLHHDPPTKRQLPGPLRPLLKCAYRHAGGLGRRAIERLARQYESEYWSVLLRELYEECHGIQVGVGSYGCFHAGVFPRGTVIGNYCSVAPGVYILNADHPLSFVTTHPMFYNPVLGFVETDRVRRTQLTIGHDVWIGVGAIILAGCTKIGTGAVVGAGSVVTRDVAPYTIVAGAPARPLRKRFDEATVAALLDSRWYELSPEELLDYTDCVADVRLFLQRLRARRRERA